MAAIQMLPLAGDTCPLLDSVRAGDAPCRSGRRAAPGRPPAAPGPRNWGSGAAIDTSPSGVVADSAIGPTGSVPSSVSLNIAVLVHAVGDRLDAEGASRCSDSSRPRRSRTAGCPSAAPACRSRRRNSPGRRCWPRSSSASPGPIVGRCHVLRRAEQRLDLHGEHRGVLRVPARPSRTPPTPS